MAGSIKNNSYRSLLQFWCICGQCSAFLCLLDTYQNLGRGPIEAPQAVPQADASEAQVLEAGGFLHCVVVCPLVVQRDFSLGLSVPFP